MFRMAALVCNGCESIGQDDFFFNPETKRPRIGKCEHTMCDKCVKKGLNCPACIEKECERCIRTVEHCDACRRQLSQNPSKTCKNCFKSVRRSGDCKHSTKFEDTNKINYAALGILEDCEQRCLEVYREWWKGAELGVGRCVRPGCPEEGKWRICVDCHGADQLRLDKFVWVYKEKVLRVKEAKKEREKKEQQRKELEDMSLGLFDEDFDSDTSSESPPPPPLPISPYRLSLTYSRHHLALLMSNLLCSGCFIDTRSEHEKPQHFFKSFHDATHTKRPLVLTNIDFWADDIKLATAAYAGSFLWMILSGEATSHQCKLGSMRFLRTCEMLIHWARLHCPFTPSRGFEPLGIENPIEWNHRREHSRVSKYFKSLDFEEKPEKSIIDELIDNLERQRQELKKITEKCQCTIYYETMKKQKLGNQVEKKYCEIAEIRPENLGGIPEHHNDTHKPCKCPKCSNSTCLECLKSDFLLKCPLCGWYFQQPYPKTNLNSPAIYAIDNEKLEIVNFHRQNALELYEKWWHFEPAIGEGYCMSCHSYTTDLELCTYCQLADKEWKLKRPNEFEFDFGFEIGSDDNIETIFTTLNKKFQCSDCGPRVKAQWTHSKCDTIGKKYLRGCHHLRSRLEYGACVTVANCGQSVLGMANLKNSKWIWKASTWHIARELLRGGLLEIGRLEVEAVEELDYNTKKYFETAFAAEENEENEEKREKLRSWKLKVKQNLEQLKQEMER